MRTEPMFSSATVEWETPSDLFAELEREFGPFTLDPCATPENAKAPRYFTWQDDGRHQSWANERVFMNPPYGREVGRWVIKAWLEARFNGAFVVCLLPARTDTGWWHDYVMKGEVRFLRGRLKFGRLGKRNAPFPSAIVIFRPVRDTKETLRGMP
jgi:phage N-6-adenine-methyltransferase